METLNATGVPFPFKLEFARRVECCRSKEHILHQLFDNYRVNSRREFFNASLRQIRLAFELIDGEWFEPYEFDDDYEEEEILESKIETVEIASKIESVKKERKPKVGPKLLQLIRNKKRLT